MIPAIDHSILSPSGNVSKRARGAALQREAARLFPAGFWDAPEPTDEQLRTWKANGLRRHAARLRDLAARGMSPKRFLKEAAKAEQQASELEASR